MSESKKLVPHPWDFYGKPTVRDVELDPDEDTWTCEYHYGLHHSVVGCLDELRIELTRAEEDAVAAYATYEELEADADEIRNAIHDLERRSE